MNMFLAQNVQTMSELKDLAAVPYMILAPRDGKPIVEVVQDTMLGAYRLTKDWVTIHDKTMANLQMVNSYFPGKLPDPKHKNDHHFTGKQAYSQILPPGLFIEMKNKADEKFKIFNSELTSGTIDKTVFHSLTRGILPIIYHDYSPFEVRRFLDNTQRLICRWLMSAGFSVGISDLVTDKGTEQKLKETISTYKGKAYLKIEDVRKGKLENNSIFTNQDFFEREILNILNELTNQVGSIGLKQIDDKTNRMINMVKSGSKGKETNVAQMIACVGQQNVDGKRVAYGFTDRTLPHYTKYDDGPEARGFVENSFISGLSPQEVFFHAMGGREGLIDTAVKSVTGDTKIFIIEDGKPRTVEIGNWIDGYLDDKINKDKIEYSETASQELLNIDKKVYIPTCDDKGVVTWGELTAVTRHDPTEKLYRVKTTGGREVIVADSDSLLIWNNNTREFKKMHSSKVTTGMFVPVTMELPEPPVIIKSVDMIDYFPKTEYIYGTEFHKADKLMKEAMSGRIQIPRGWWEKHNGKTFTLPYPDKAKLQRAVSGRCNLDNLKEGYIYPYHATRQHSLMPEKFELNYENGQFIGLFLADGNAEIKSGQVHITKENEEVKSFVKRWFEKFSMKYAERVDERERGKITIVTGYSTYMAMFLHKFVGHTCEGKYVPDVAFIAPEEFVRGMISGYFSGDGSVPKKYKGITASSVSRNLIEGINLLLVRLGIFAKMSTRQQEKNNLGTENILPTHILTIRAQWARLFRDKIDLIPNYKNEELKNIDGDYLHRNYPYQNDVVLDTIKEIRLVNPKNYPKLYDISVPSTLNFQTRMGWIVHDTSETGYIQRRLVKAMEDCKVYYDQTVRNATGAIVQYVYGEDGIDGTKIENQYIPYVTMNLIEMDIKYNLRPEDKLELYLTEDAMKKIVEEPEWIDKSQKFYEDLLDDRQYLIHNIFKGEKSEKIQYPIPFDRIIKNALQRLSQVAPTVIPTDLTPNYILNAIDMLIDKLTNLQKDQGIKYLQILIRVNLAPKVLIVEHHMSKTIFEWVVNEIEERFMKSLVHPGEMVGIIAAQSIGELGTQQSVTKNTKVNIICDGNKIYNGEIGNFIDQIINDNKDRVIHLDNNSVVINMLENELYEIVSLSQNEKLHWSRISQISRHPTNGNLIKIKTKYGKEVTATLSHSFLKRTETCIIPIIGANLVVGDRIPVAKFIPLTNQVYDKEFTKYNFTVSETDDIIPDVNNIINKIQPSLNKTNYTRTEIMNIIQSSNNNDIISLELLQQAVNSDVIYDEIVSIEIIEDPKEYVYDFSIPINESFMVNDGVLVHNTLDSFHSSGTAAAVKATSGVPRLKELLSVSKNIKTPSLIIYLKEDIGQVTAPSEGEDGSVNDPRVQESKEKCIKVMQQLEITRMVDILDSTEIYWDPPGDRGLQTGITDDDGMLAVYRTFANIDENQCRSQSPWVLRMKINKDKMYRLGLTMMDIYIKLHTAYNQSIECVFNDDNAHELIFRIRLTKDALKDVDPDDYISALKAMEHNIVNNVLLKGLKGIKKVSMRSKSRQIYSEDKDKFEKTVEWILDTDGTNLQDIFANLNIDQIRTRSNDVYEIYQTLGIEAARNALYIEFMEVVGEGAINYRHMSLLLDTMTNRGTLMSVDRHGINRGDVGPLAKSSFEETTDMLINASIFSEHDRINGVSANIMLGQLPPCGTGDHEILLDEDAFLELIKNKKPLHFNEPPDASGYSEQQACAVENIAFNYKLPEKNNNIKAFPKQSVTFV